MVEEWLEGAYDLHVHSAPDVFERKFDDLALAERFAKAKMKGFGIKSHYFNTAERARLVRKLYPQINAVGAITLNYSVGGLNALAVELAARDGAKIVWMPTFDSANERDYFMRQNKYDRLPYWARLQLELKEKGITQEEGGISVLKDGRLTKQAREVLEIIAEHQMILATGHLSREEIFALVKVAKEQNVKKVVITHPTFPSVGLSKQEQKELAEMGAYLEHCFALIQPKFGIDWDELYELIRYVGPQHCILSSDVGQPYNPYPDEALRNFAANLASNGFTREEIRTMAVTNSTYLVEG